MLYGLSDTFLRFQLGLFIVIILTIAFLVYLWQQFVGKLSPEKQAQIHYIPTSDEFNKLKGYVTTVADPPVIAAVAVLAVAIPLLILSDAGGLFSSPCENQPKVV